LVVATAVTLGLAARERTGTGQQVLVDMFGANTWANHDDFLDYPGKAPRALPDAGLHGLTPTYRLYPCAEGQWIFLGLGTARERQLFVDVLQAAGYAAASSIITLDSLSDAGKVVEDALAKLFSTAGADHWEALLAGAGIGCVRADGSVPSEFWRSDAQPRALGLHQRIEHARWGSYERHGRMVFFDDGLQPLKPPPLAGQHNAEILTALGYEPARIAELHADGTLFRDVRPLPVAVAEQIRP